MFSIPAGNPAPRMAGVGFSRDPGTYAEAAVSGETLYITSFSPAGVGVAIEVDGLLTLYSSPPSTTAPGFAVSGFGGAGSSLRITVWTYQGGRRSANHLTFDWVVTT